MWCMDCGILRSILVYASYIVLLDGICGTLVVIRARNQADMLPGAGLVTRRPALRFVDELSEVVDRTNLLHVGRQSEVW